jgi:hypothetical protein
MVILSRVFKGRFIASSYFALAILLAPSASAQSTAAVQGTVTDPSGAVLPSANIMVHNEATGEERSTVTDTEGAYSVPSLPVGTYRIEAKANGMQTTVVNQLTLAVGTTVRQDFSMKLAGTSATVEITAAPPVIESTTVAVGGVVNQRTVQEIPLNGRHFVDLAELLPGTVTPPASGFLTAPLRGQGSFAFNTAGAREDQINFMINGINLSDPSNNQITFQPVISTVQEFKLDNSTYSASTAGTLAPLLTSPRAAAPTCGTAKLTSSSATIGSTRAISPIPREWLLHRSSATNSEPMAAEKSSRTKLSCS